MKKIISYNVNGIRAALNKGLLNWLEDENPDIICFQELKATPDQFNVMDFQFLGYHTHWFPAEKKGYSGVALLSKEEPVKVTYGMRNNLYDMEGRLVKADFKNFSVISVYIPSGTMGDIRQDFKMEFLSYFTDFIAEERKKTPNLIVSGDYNICHKPIDINHPERHQNMSGFLPEEREWFDRFVESGMVDSFRKFNQQPNQYSWWSYRAGARQKNLGWRIDYHLVSKEFEKAISGATILPEAMHSDHCPVCVTIDA